jgi:hypothetical protein
LNCRLCLLFLLQDHRSHNLLHVVVLEVHLGGEASHEALQGGGIGQRALPRADHKHPAIQLLGEGLDHLLDIVGDVRVVVDELLNLVQDHQGAGELAVARKGAADGGEHVVDTDLLDLGRILGAQGRTDILDVAEVGIARKIGFLQDPRGVEPGQLRARVLARPHD